MELTGRILKIFEQEEGTGANGFWFKTSILIEKSGKFPRKVHICFWKSRIDFSKYQVDDVVKVKFDMESHERKEKWYTMLWGWYIAKTDDFDVWHEDKGIIVDDTEEELPF
jgi:hypothetical protein